MRFSSLYLILLVSLLGTWQGDESEMWNPKKSNILQLIISIQGLILGVREPYYLEAGYALRPLLLRVYLSHVILSQAQLLLRLNFAILNSAIANLRFLTLFPYFVFPDIVIPNLPLWFSTFLTLRFLILSSLCDT